MMDTAFDLRRINFKRLISFKLFIIIILLCPRLEAQVTPTDVFYLARSIDDSLKATYGLTGQYDAQPITKNAKPRNVYQKALAVVEEFETLHPGSIDILRVQRLKSIDTDSIRPENVYNLLALIKNYFVYKDSFVEYQGARESKSPSHVFQMLRSITYHHVQIAKQKELQVDWATPTRVFHANITEVVPVLYTLAMELGITHEKYGFPLTPQGDIKPRHVYKLLQMTYRHVADYYANTTNYEPIILDEIEAIDSITPGDVFDLTKILAAELKTLQWEEHRDYFDMELSLHYAQWKRERSSIGPGDVYPLIQHAFNLAKQVTEESI